MSDIKATVQSQPITATASGGGISASVGSSSVTASVGGGIGPRGPQGSLGAGLGDLIDVTLDGTAAGDVLRYDDGTWKNYKETDLLDGGNY
jgi:hypothetical protein